MTQRLLVSALALALTLVCAQRRVDPRNSYNRAITSAALAQQPGGSSNPFYDRFLKMSRAEAIAYANTAFDHGMATDDIDGLGVLARSQGSVVLPVLERRIEEVLKSPNPLDCFTDKSADPKRAVDLAAGTIAYAGDGNALKEISKLLAIDDRRFGWLVKDTLLSSDKRRFEVAYNGFDIGSEVLSKRIIACLQEQFATRGEFDMDNLKHWWAEAMAKRYGDLPPEVIWVNDPIMKGLKPELAASLHDEVLRLEMAANASRAKK